MAEFRATTGDPTYEWEVTNDHVIVSKVRGEDRFDIFSVDDIDNGRTYHPGASADLDGLIDLVDAAEDAIMQAWDQEQEIEEEFAQDAFTLAVEYLYGAFTWADTNEGHEFYRNLTDVLMVASASMHASDWDLPEGALETDAGDPCGHAAIVLVEAFDWEATEERWTFWNEIMEILQELSYHQLPTFQDEDPFGDQPSDVEPYSQGDQLELFPDLSEPTFEQPEVSPEIDRYFEALDRAAEEAMDETQNSIEAVIRETGETPDVMVMEFDVPGGTLVVEAVRVA